MKNKTVLFAAVLLIAFILSVLVYKRTAIEETVGLDDSTAPAAEKAALPPSSAPIVSAPSEAVPVPQTARTGILELMNRKDRELLALSEDLRPQFLSLLQGKQHLYQIADTEVQPLATALADARAAQLLYEHRDMATIVPGSKDEVLVKIAAYEEEGEKLMASLDEKLVTVMKDAAEVEEFWGLDVLKEFCFFGRYPQELLFSRKGSVRASGAVEITQVLITETPELATHSNSLLMIDDLDQFAPYAHEIGALR